MRASLRLLSTASTAGGALRPNTVGWIGLGAMGREMLLHNLVKKRFDGNGNGSVVPRVAILDENRQAMDTFLDAYTKLYPKESITLCESPAELAQLSSTIITMLPSSPQVESVYLNPSRGLLSSPLPSPSPSPSSPSSSISTLFIDCTTLDRAVSRKVSKLVSNHHKEKKTDGRAEMVDAPVSGGVVGAKAGTLSFMCGGHEEAFNQARNYLDMMGRRAIYCGQSGNGLAAKISNNLLLGISMIGTAEAMLLGTRMGLKPDLLAEIINTSTGKCWSSEINNPHPTSLPNATSQPPSHRGYQGGFLSRLMAKDLSLAVAAAEERPSTTPTSNSSTPSTDPDLEAESKLGTSTDLPMGKLAERIYENLKNDGRFEGRDFSVVYEWLQEGGWEKVDQGGEK